MNTIGETTETVDARNATGAASGVLELPLMLSPQRGLCE